MKYVYVIGNGSGLVKVGVSSNPSKRSAQVSSASGFDCYVVSTLGPCEDFMAIESAAHHTLREFSTRGEWFKCTFDKAIEACNEAAISIGLDCSMEMHTNNKEYFVESNNCDVDEFIRLAIGGEVEDVSGIEKFKSSGGGAFITGGEIFFCTPVSEPRPTSIAEQCANQLVWCQENGEIYEGVDVVNFDTGDIDTHFLHDLALEKK